MIQENLVSVSIFVEFAFDSLLILILILMNRRNNEPKWLVFNPSRLVLIRVALVLICIDLCRIYGGSSRACVGLALICIDSCALE